jgi:hypothetical protein
MPKLLRMYIFYMVDIIQPYLDRIVDWGTKAGLKFIENKTVAVMFTGMIIIVYGSILSPPSLDPRIK